LNFFSCFVSFSDGQSVDNRLKIQLRWITRNIQIEIEHFNSRDLGVLLDSEMTMRQHINHVVSVGFYHLRRLRQIRRHISRDVIKQLVCSLVLSRMDYRNSILTGLPASTLAPLQRLQNAAARLVMCLRARDHVTSALSDLHWLPVCFRIKYKVALIMFYIHNRQCPAYLTNIVTSLNIDPSRRRLRSSAGTVWYQLPDPQNEDKDRREVVFGCWSNHLELAT
jgi:hypothetical protein